MNTADDLPDLPAGREDTKDCSSPLGVVKMSDGRLLMHAARKGDVSIHISVTVLYSIS